MKKKMPWLAALLNFFLMGLGTAYNGRRIPLGLALTIGAVLLTYVEQNLQAVAPNLYWVMFGAVFLNNTFLAIDGFSEATAINAGR
jgi:uncharacterized membrane protein